MAESTCVAADCHRLPARRSRGYCHGHYKRLQRAGQLPPRPPAKRPGQPSPPYVVTDAECAVCGKHFPSRRYGNRPPARSCSPSCRATLALSTRRTVSIEERFWSRVRKSETCWTWAGERNPGGYGKFGYDYESYLAHRLSYTLLVGPIPDGLVIDHMCRNRACVNPAHLRTVTLGENTMAQNSQSPSRLNKDRTHCIHGHAFDEANTYRDRRGRRHCRACHRPKECRNGHAWTPDNTGHTTRGTRLCLTCARTKAA